MITIKKSEYYPICLILGTSICVSVYVYGFISKDIQTQAYGAFGLFLVLMFGTIILAIKIITAGCCTVGDEK